MNREYFDEVNEKEFIEFLKWYPNQLTQDWCTFCFPEALCFYDFTLDKQYNIVAAKSYDFKDPENYKDEYDTFFIRKNWYKKFKNEEQ